MAPRFGLTPDEITSTATSWQTQADVVGGVSFDALGNVAGTGSTVMDALRASVEPAQRCTQSIGDRLDSLGTRLHKFNSDVAATEALLAKSFTDLPSR